jgi:hypothetical protein
MLHVRIFFHQRSVLEILGGAGEYEFMVINSIIPNDKLYLLAKAHLERLWGVPHTPFAVMDIDADDTKRLCRIARLAGRKVLPSVGIRLRRSANRAGCQRGTSQKNNAAFSEKKPHASLQASVRVTMREGPNGWSASSASREASKHFAIAGAREWDALEIGGIVS